MRRKHKEPAIVRPAAVNAPAEVTEAGLRQIERDASEGLAITTIATRLGIDRATLARLRKRDPRVQEALERGRGLLEDELTDILLTHARKGNVVAAIWLSKARAGWHETGPRDQGASVNVQINLPGPMDEAAYRRTVDVTLPGVGGTDGE